MLHDRPPETVAELREQLHAETQLAKLELFEDLAVLHDSETVLTARKNLALLYRQAVGVLPAQRQAFQEALERVLADGGRH